MEIVFLGTSSMVPTKERNQSAVFISHGSEGILVDCGEGTQRQFKITGIPLTKITRILVSHWHGDHVLGLPGVIQTLNSSTTGHRLQVFGPKGTRAQFEHMGKTFLMEYGDGRLKLEVNDIEEGMVFENDDFYIESKKLQHSVPCLGYSIVQKDRVHINLAAVKKLGLPEGPLLGQLQAGKTVTWKGKIVKPSEVTYATKGKKVTVIMDTELCNSAIELAEGADVLICEATYADELEGKAGEYKHLTAGQAATIANKAGAGKLVLTHFSQRYKTTQQVEEDARTTFDNVICAKDFMRLEV
ncbi:ribonuclease Z [Candidatus Woesearchaeota archaeon]|nr:ribonuclease Z [Candidatus Woesearchaeota archaeon]